MELWHHGIKGQKWGVRRYQNPDGSLTSAGKKRYSIDRQVTEQSDYKITKTTIKGGKANENSALNKIDASKGDAWEQKGSYDIFSKYDNIGSNALRTYKEKGEKAAIDYLNNKIDDGKYEFVINDEEIKNNINNGEKYISFTLKVLGKDTYFTTGGDEDYTDDQRFGSLKADRSKQSKERKAANDFNKMSKSEKDNLLKKRDKLYEDRDKIWAAIDGEYVKDPKTGKYVDSMDLYFPGKSYNEIKSMKDKLNKEIDKIESKIPRGI